LGWDNWYGGITAQWYLPNPIILTDAGSLGVASNQFGFTISWATNSSVVEACTNLAGGNWVPVETNTLDSGSAYFADPQWTNCASRFYRVHVP
jgi:hypothetical protein